MKLALVFLVFLLILPSIFAQSENCYYVCPEDVGNPPIDVTGGFEDASPTGIGLMTMIISMSVLAGWWIKSSMTKILKKRLAKKSSRKKPSSP